VRIYACGAHRRAEVLGADAPVHAGHLLATGQLIAERVDARPSSCAFLSDFDQRLCGNAEPFMQSPDHFERERAPTSSGPPLFSSMNSTPISTKVVRKNGDLQLFIEVTCFSQPSS
jgi:hypothetical protein